MQPGFARLDVHIYIWHMRSVHFTMLVFLCTSRDHNAQPDPKQLFIPVPIFEWLQYFFRYDFGGAIVNSMHHPELIFSSWFVGEFALMANKSLCDRKRTWSKTTWPALPQVTRTGEVMVDNWLRDHNFPKRSLVAQRISWPILRPRPHYRCGDYR